MKIWLDDIRRPRTDWKWVASSAECIELLSKHPCEHLSLDHDLGLIDLKDDEPFEDTGYQVVLWMEEHSVWPEKITLHTSNAVGAANMRRGILASGLYKAFGPCRFVRKDILAEAEQLLKDQQKRQADEEDSGRSRSGPPAYRSSRRRRPRS